MTSAQPQPCNTASANFFAGRAFYPRPRKKGQRDSVGFTGGECAVPCRNAKGSYVHLAKIGLVKFQDSRARRDSLQNMMATRAKRLAWILLRRGRASRSGEVSAIGGH